MNTSHPNAKNHERTERAITLMLKYMRGELTGELEAKAARAVENCQSCRNLYEELRNMFDPIKNMEYELEHPEEIERTDRLFEGIFSLHQPTVTSSMKSSFSNLALADFEETDCLGCGA